MINLDEINSEIEKLESMSASYTTIEKLSWLYTVRDHLSPTKDVEAPDRNTEYILACSGKSMKCVLEVMDELMSTLLVIQPRLYNAVMDKLS